MFCFRTAPCNLRTQKDAILLLCRTFKKRALTASVLGLTSCQVVEQEEHQLQVQTAPVCPVLCSLLIEQPQATCAFKPWLVFFSFSIIEIVLRLHLEGGKHVSPGEGGVVIHV